MKFLCDQMLGTLAKWLRILGFDTYFADEKVKDIELLNIAQDENRILISRDKELIQRCKKRQIDSIFLESKDLDEQIKKTLKNINVNKNQILTRCTVCNSILEKVEKKQVKGKVPEKVFNFKDEFWYCPNCDKFYWHGSHFDKMKQKIRELNR